MKSGTTADGDRISNLSELFAAGLGHPANSQKVKEFAALQAQFQERQMKLAQRAMANEISRDTYVAELDKAMQMLAKSGEGLFGFEDFHKVFGDFSPRNMFDTRAFVDGDRMAR